MSLKLIPEHIDPFRHAEQSLSLSGIVKIQDMQRLSTIVAEHDDSEVQVDLHFGIDEQKVPFLKGSLKTQLKLQCQRCMEPFVYEIITDFVLGIVNTLDEANALPEYYEPVLAKEGSLALRELIEDEIILNLPIIPRHEPADCEITLPLAESESEHVKGKNPFHVLASLKVERK